MNKNITCILPYAPIDELKSTIKNLKDSAMVEKIIVVAPEVVDVEGVDVLVAEGGIYVSSTWKALVERMLGGCVAVYTKPMALVLGQNALERMSKACADTGAGMVYSDFYERKEGQLAAHPVIDYQEGSLRDDFDFGSLMFFKKEAFVKAINEMDADYKFAALYDVRLRVSQNYELFHLPELLYTEVELDTRKSGEKMFDYVDPRNRDRQVEMELACTAHLKKVGAYLKPDFKKIDFSESKFPVEASVIIPVRNREKTVADAIESVLKQKTIFAFNLIIVDNHSTDKTTEIIQSFKDDRIVHIIPERDDLGIGGCWNRAVEDERCGKFAVQLDSDDLYIDETVLEQVVQAFYEQNCAMVVGSYQMVNFKLEEIPPGLIDHKEWTADNGRNNALRINGLGAPRAFYTPVIRDVKVPNTSYGEDYALGLNISRNYQIGRIYNPLYLCRRWEDNSDASLDINKMNVHNLYKDKIRTMELKARQQVVKRQKI
ncbi:glycosyltransferase family 2 protein [Carboxylicivirga linearis]|uniref:Glycosyltransferase family 2 protein n=1 Tax=Carboxylicivirga linearis TaxID=1628157 RepID=A0ABS5JYD7_9BACT|nr:glycosyltransferase family A protein [Carboxylicivirga linearis]MBS2099876.1 glycosyltransferase family 2 protein [Carboxylicivirga linearis]